MSSFELSEEEANTIVEEQKGMVDEDVLRWSDNGGTLTVKFHVQTTDGVVLSVRGWVNKKSKNYGFALLFREKIPIRRWDMRKGHKDPITRQKSSGPHKHFHNPDYEDSRSYDTNDISTTDARDALIAFLRECNVSFELNRIPRPFITNQHNLQDFGVK